jgi:hypothetical protein
MSLYVICKWRPGLHIYSEKMAGRWRREAVENRQEAGSGGKRGKKIGGRREAVDAREEKWREDRGGKRWKVVG